jgi:drug/metabolite transporter (DMT)-like permease
MGLVILLRVFFSVSANAVQKRLLRAGVSVSLTWLWTYGLMVIPVLLLSSRDLSTLGADFWLNISLGGVIDVLGNLAMVAALKTMDLSVFGPLNGLRPVLAVLFGFLFFGEIPRAAGWGGIALTAVGTMLLAPPGEKRGAFAFDAHAWRAFALRLAGLSLGVFGAVFLKRAAAIGSAGATVAGWTFSGFLPLAPLIWLMWPNELKQTGAVFRAHRSWLILHASFFLLMQWLTIRIFQETMLAYSFVFFQLGMLLQVIAGKVFFSEPRFGKRLFASAVIASGSILILWKG